MVKNNTICGQKDKIISNLINILDIAEGMPECMASIDIANLANETLDILEDICE